MKQTSTFTYNAPKEIYIGDVFYKIEAVDFQHFHEPCLVCGDKRELTVNGVTFICPCCGSTKETIRINGYVVRRYRVFKISDEVRNSDWKPDNHHRITFGIYRKAGLGYQWADHSVQSFDEYDLEHYFNVAETGSINIHNVDKYIFDDYRLAVNVAKILTAAEVQNLKEYNDAHGSNYEPVFKTENDKKSN